MAQHAAITTTTLRELGEGYRVLTREGLLPAVQWVDWVGEGGAEVEAVLLDDSELHGDGGTLLQVVWQTDAAQVTAAALAAAPSRDALGVTLVPAGPA